MFSPDFLSGNKPFYIFLFFILFCCEAKTQTEYITNGSFEDIDSCYGNAAPIGFDVFQWSGCNGWSNPIKSSSDLWCENPKMGIITPPNVLVGYQFPRSGNNMASILINDGIVRNYREYIQNKLTQTLKNNIRYELSFYLTGNYIECSPITFGIKLFNNKFNDISKFWLTDFTPDATNDINQCLIDSLNWQLIKIDFTGKGDENYIVIGNFEDSTKIKYNTPCDTSGWGNNNYAGNYFFIDDFSIIELPFKEPLIPNIFTPNNDGANDNWIIDLSGYENINCNVYNRWGIKMYQTNNTLISWDGRTNTGESCNDGIYFYTIEAINPYEEKKEYKGYIQFVR